MSVNPGIRFTFLRTHMKHPTLYPHSKAQVPSRNPGLPKLFSGGAVGIEHSDPLKPRNLFILRYAQDIKNAQNARRRYTAGTPIAREAQMCDDSVTEP